MPNRIIKISIHPPRVGWDNMALSPFFPEVNFNPPTPGGVGQLLGTKYGEGI